MRFHQPAKPAQLFSEIAIITTDGSGGTGANIPLRDAFYGGATNYEDGVATLPSTAFPWGARPDAERNAENLVFDSLPFTNADRVQDIRNAQSFRILRAQTSNNFFTRRGQLGRWTLSGGAGITSAFVHMRRTGRENDAREPLRLGVQDGDARAALVHVFDEDNALFYIERRGGGNLAGAQIVTHRSVELRFGFRAAVGRGKWIAEPPVTRVTLEEVRNKRKGIFSNLTFTNFYQTPRLSLQWGFNNHPSSEDGRSVAALVAASRSTQRGFLLWTGGNELFNRTKPAPPSETAWHDVLVERRMVVDAHQGGGGAYSGARVGAGFTGAVSIAETA